MLSLATSVCTLSLHVVVSDRGLWEWVWGCVWCVCVGGGVCGVCVCRGVWVWVCVCVCVCVFYFLLDYSERPHHTSWLTLAPGGTHMLRHTGMCRPNGLLFHQKSLDMDPLLFKKILWRGSHFTKIATKKNAKSAVFEVEKPLEMGPDLQKKSKKTCQISRFFFFLREKKPLDVGRGFKLRAAHLRQK